MNHDKQAHGAAHNGPSVHSSRPNPFINRQPLKEGRAAFLERIRKGLGHPLDKSPAPAEPPPAHIENIIRQFGANDPGRIDRFIAKAKGNTMVVHRVNADAAAIAAAIDACFAPHKITRSILNAGELANQFALPQYLASKNIAVIPWGAPNCAADAFTADASITDCRAGLADAGSLLVWSDPTFGRSSTLVVPVHIILLPASRILPDMIDGLAFAHAQTAGAAGSDGRLPSNIVIINGPSKTADIEMNLVTGVHGPKYLYVIVIDGI